MEPLLEPLRSLLRVARSGKPSVQAWGEPEFERLREEMQAAIEARGGDVAARAHARSVGEAYGRVPVSARGEFFALLASFDTDAAAVEAALDAVRTASGDAERRPAEVALRKALVPARTRLLRALNSSAGGVKLLVEMRAHLLDLLPDAPALGPLEADFRDLLATWFDVGFLQLQRITWDSPASMLEKLARYEAVHEMRGWADLKNRLDVDRRCFAFLHPAMPDEPLIFVEVALTTEMSGKMAPLLDQRAPVTDAAAATHAIFYSISNCQRGLDGISFGNALLKRVVEELSQSNHNLRTFVTLSPIPGFLGWLERHTPHLEDSRLHAVLATRNWWREEEVAQSLRAPLLQLCASYLMQAKHGQRTLDPVAHFHLGNGARIERLNWLADVSTKGLRTSAGMMVNYLYRLDQIDANQTAYANSGRIAASPEIQNLFTAPRGGSLVGSRQIS